MARNEFAIYYLDWRCNPQAEVELAVSKVEVDTKAKASSDSSDEPKIKSIDDAKLEPI